MKIRKRLNKEQTNLLGLKWRGYDSTGRSPRYMISLEQLKELKNTENKKYQKKTHLNDKTALDLGLTLKPTNKYHLTSFELKQFAELDMCKIKRLFFDIETSPIIAYTWRIGYNLNIPYENIINDWKIICVSYKWEDEDNVHTFRWNNFDDRQLLIDFIKIANTADELIGHNGDRFDLKKLRTRAIIQRVPMFPKYRTLDTLKKSRGNFAFNSNRLTDIGQALGVGEKMKHQGFDMWVKCMQGEKEALKEMVNYCERDVILLEDIYHRLENYIKPETHVGVHNGKLKASCPICGSIENIKLLKNDVTEKGSIGRIMECESCGHIYNISNSAYGNYLKYSL